MPLEPELPQNDMRPSKPKMKSEPVDKGRRNFLRVAAGALLLLGLGPAARRAEAQDTSGSDADGNQKAVQDPHHASFGLQVLDIIGTASFVDAVHALATDQPSKAAIVADIFTFRKKALATVQDADHSPEGEQAGQHHDHEHDDHHVDFPLQNMALAIALNLIRMTAFDHETSHHTVEELKTTVVGVGLLMGLTSLAKGIVEAEREAGRMAQADEQSIQEQPQQVIADSIFQLTCLATVTQLPLTAFGNASIGKGEFDEVEKAFNVAYQRWGGGWGEGFSRTQLEDEFKSGVMKEFNPVISKRIGKLLGKTELSDEELLEAVKAEAKDHTHDLMIVLMSTACDDAQAALGDAGPLVGLFQAFGTDFWKAVGPTIPYTVLVALDRAYLAAQRAGVPISTVINYEKFDYLQQFVTTTWKNLLAYFVHIGPELTSKITGSARADKREVTGGPGRDFDVVQQMFRDVESFFNALRDGFRSDESFDIHSVKRAVAKMARAGSDYRKIVGEKTQRIFAEAQDSSETVSVPISVNREAKDIAFGPVSEDEQLGMMQEKVRAMALDPDTQNAVEQLAQEFAAIREEHGPQILKAMQDEIKKAGGATPSLNAVAVIMRKNPAVLDLLDFNYWHDRIGAELTDTMFVVFLQGLHLSFIISTVEKFVYRNPHFKAFPLAAQEILTVLLNDVLSMFADNWADCVAHSKWLTTMYFNQLDKIFDELRDQCADDPQMEKAIAAFSFSDDSTQIVPERYRVRREQFTALTLKLIEIRPGSEAELLRTLERYYDEGEKYYYKSMIMSLITAVTGGGKALTGNAPHFTFKNGHEDYKLSTTLADIKNHPVYHAWEFLFSTTYSTVMGPAYARAFFSRDHGQEIHDMMKRRFRENYPDFEDTLRKLEEAQGSSGQPR